MEETGMDKSLSEWGEFSIGHLSQRPEMELGDIYKLLYQGILGPEHLITSPDVFIQRLKAEWQEQEREKDDRIYEPVRPVGSLVRVNLRPFKAASGNLNALVDVCLETAEMDWGTLDELDAIWKHTTEVILEGDSVNFSHQEIEGFSLWLQDKNYPALHHSERYRRRYRPAYRLIAAERGTYLIA
jgi:hypothetical protein